MQLAVTAPVAKMDVLDAEMAAGQVPAKRIVQQTVVQVAYMAAADAKGIAQVPVGIAAKVGVIRGAKVAARIAVTAHVALVLMDAVAAHPAVMHVVIAVVEVAIHHVQDTAAVIVMVSVLLAMAVVPAAVAMVLVVLVVIKHVIQAVTLKYRSVLMSVEREREREDMLS